MRILVTNDDGMHASQLPNLVRWCKTLGDVTVIVPKVEQSGKSHGIQLREAFEIKEDVIDGDIPILSVDSTPADCVRYAVLGLKQKFDLVVSGVNRGMNLGKDIMYSGTVGAVSEAVALGIPAVAFSIDPSNYDSACDHLSDAWDFIQKHNLYSLNSAYNVNFPPMEPKGIRVTRQGGPYYSDDFELVGENLYHPRGKMIWHDQGDMTLDTDCVMHGYISVMPLSATRADMGVYEKIKDLTE